MRNLLLDLMREGRRRNTIYILGEADVGDALPILRGLRCSLTSYLVRCFASAVADKPLFNTYRCCWGRMTSFASVDVAVMVEREVDGDLQAVHYILRDAQSKTLQAIHAELHFAKTAPLEKVLKRRDRIFFCRMPRLVRRAFWAWCRCDPRMRKRHAGTVGLSSMGMFGSGASHPVIVNPMTCTLAIGTVARRPAIIDGGLTEREMLCFTVCADHDLIDGAPLMRFTEDLKSRIGSDFESL